MSHTREILTFQFGTYANYVGAHFWNQQEAHFIYNGAANDIPEGQYPVNDVLYRAGLNDQNRTTYTPRLLSVDLAGTFAHIPVEGELYGNYIQRDSNTDLTEQTKKTVESSAMVSNPDEIDVCAQPPAPMSEYQADLLTDKVDMKEKDYRLAESSQTWADFLYARYHPRTLNVLRQHVRDDASVQAVGTHATGAELWESEPFNDDFCDRIRRYVEECDALQGCQLLFDIDDGFGGLAGKCLEHFNDEYNRMSFALPVHYPRHINYQKADTQTAHSIRVLNAVLSYNQLVEHASMFTPLSTVANVWRTGDTQTRQFPGACWQSDNLYHTSAVLAAYLDTITMSYRLPQSPETLPIMCERLTMSGRKFTAAAMAMPLGMSRNHDLIDYLDAVGETPLLQQLTPHCDAGTAYVNQSVVMRGIHPDRLKRKPQDAGDQLRMAAYRCETTSQMMQLYFQCAFHNSCTNCVATQLPLKTHLPFPYEIFESHVGEDGFLLGDGDAKRDLAATRVQSAPVLAAVQNSTRLGKHLDALHSQTHRINFTKLKRHLQGGIERDEFDASLDRLLEFRDNYADEQFL